MNLTLLSHYFILNNQKFRFFVFDVKSNFYTLWNKVTIKQWESGRSWIRVENPTLQIRIWHGLLCSRNLPRRSMGNYNIMHFFLNAVQTLPMESIILSFSLSSSPPPPSLHHPTTSFSSFSFSSSYLSFPCPPASPCHRYQLPVK